MPLLLASARGSGNEVVPSNGLPWFTSGDGQVVTAIRSAYAKQLLRLRHASTGYFEYSVWDGDSNIYSPPSKSADTPDFPAGWLLHPSEQGSASCPISVNGLIPACTDQLTGPPQESRYPGLSNGQGAGHSSKNEAAQSLLLKHAAASSRRKRKADCEAARQNVLISDVRPHRLTKIDPNGQVQGVFTTFGTELKVRASYSAKERTATAFNRKVGACSVCRRLKWRCPPRKDEYTPCERCSELTKFSPCIIANILEINLFRLGSTRDNSLRKWMWLQKIRAPGASVRRILITQDLGYRLEVPVSYFTPEPDDVLSYDWKTPDGEARQLHMPPYYISDMDGASASMLEFFKLSSSAYIESLLDSQNDIVRRNFEIARRCLLFNKSKLISDAFIIWAATRITERTWRICGPDTLDCLPVDEISNPWNGTIPVTPIMDTQLDDLVIRSVLLPTQKRVLQDLDDKIKSNSRQDWFEVYLFMFITMNNFDCIFSDLDDYKDRHALDGTPRGRPDLIASYVHACKALLAHFHFTYRGAAPLHLDWTKPQSSAITGRMSREQITHLQDLTTDLARRQASSESVQLPSDRRPPSYWSSQVLVETWTADLPHMGPVLELTEEDLLTS